MSWNDLFGPETRKIAPATVSVPRDKADRTKYVQAMAREMVRAMGKTWEETPGDDRLSVIEAMEALLTDMERGRFN